MLDTLVDGAMMEPGNGTLSGGAVLETGDGTLVSGDIVGAIVGRDVDSIFCMVLMA